MEDLNLVVLASRWIHLASAIVAVGGAAFMRLALRPAVLETFDEKQHDRLREAVRRRWATVIHVCIGALLITGAVNFTILVLLPRVEPMPYHAIFGLKVLAALGVFFIAIALHGRSAGFASVRRAAGRWLTVLLVLAGVIVLLSGILNQVRAAHRAGESESATALTPQG